MDFLTISYYALILFPVFYTSLTLTLYLLSLLPLPRSQQTTTFFARTLAAYGTLVLCALYGVFASLFLRLIGNPRLSQWAVARSFKYSMALTTDVRFEIVSGADHLDHTRPAILVANHQSALDILLLGTVWPHYCSVTAKKSLKWMPFLGWFMALSGTVFIDRANKERAIAAFDGAAEEMRRYRQSVFIFPEGTRRNLPDPTLGGFKKGAFHLAVRAQVPIVPVVCANYWGVLGVKERRFRSGRIPVRVLEPVKTEGLGKEDVDALCERVRALMERELLALSESPMGRKAGVKQVQRGEEDLAKLAHDQQKVNTNGLEGKAVSSGLER